MSTYSFYLSNDPIHKGVLVRLTGRQLKKRRSLNLTLVLDVSGSMGRPATMPSVDGKSTESYAFTLLDTVKHACKAIAQQMNDTDVLSLVTFSTNALVRFSPQKMTVANRHHFFHTLQSIQVDGQTNIYAGIERGVDVLRNAADIAAADALHQVIMLTDGMPNLTPAIGNVKAVENLFNAQKHDNFIFTLNALAFGYDDMHSKELAKLASICNQGDFTFIPDMGMVGSVFVNLLSTMFATVEQNIQITVNDEVSVPTTTTVPLLQAGQVIDVWIPVMSPDGVEVNVHLPGGQQQEAQLAEVNNMLVHASQCLLQSLEVAANYSVAPQMIAEPFQIPAWCKIEAVRRLPLYIDIYAEGVKALQPLYFEKWGRHYLQSLYSAHRRQVCNNFKDEGVQAYATPFFLECQAQGNHVFNSLPPPVANPICRGGTLIAASSSINYSGNPCVHGSSLVVMADGTFKLAEDIVRGDVVRTENVVDGVILETSATIECVLKTMCVDGKTDLCTLKSGLMITPYHPVAFDAETFCFPIAIVPPTQVPCTAVYSFLLRQTDRGETMIIHGTNVIVLGSNITTGVAAHPFFSSYTSISNALKQFKGWSSGLIVCNPNPVLRDEKTQLVNGFDYTKEILV